MVSTFEGLKACSEVGFSWYVFSSFGFSTGVDSRREFVPCARVNRLDSKLPHIDWRRRGKSPLLDFSGVEDPDAMLVLRSAKPIPPSTLARRRVGEPLRGFDLSPKCTEGFVLVLRASSSGIVSTNVVSGVEF